MSRDHVQGRITVEDAEWAIAVVDHLTRRQIYLAHHYLAASGYDAKLKRVLRAILAAGQEGITMDRLGRRTHLPAKDRREILADLLDRGDVRETQETTGGRPVVRIVASQFS